MKKSSELVRLQKFISEAGVASRRKAEELIAAGLVTVNGETVREMGIKINPAIDVVEVDGSMVDCSTVEKVYVVLNKPKAVMTTADDPEGRETVMDFCKEISQRIYPVGRLDYHSEGLLILTNDGDLAYKITHPKFEIEKVYEVKVFGIVSDELLRKIKSGIISQGEKLKPKSVRIIKKLENKTWLEFRLIEGKNREIRRICENLGLTIDKLKRVAIEGLSIGKISLGRFQTFTKRKMLDLLNMNEDGSRRKSDKTFVSAKRTVKAVKDKDRERKFEKGVSADDEKFVKYRKENYKDTIQKHKEYAENEKIKEELQKKIEREEALKEHRRRSKAKAERKEKRKQNMNSMPRKNSKKKK